MAEITAHASISIKTSAEQVWRALTDPQLVKQYMFGAQVVSNWKKGSPIVYRGEWEGKPYEDKGIIQDIKPGSRLVMTYFSPFSGDADVPENYMLITYEISETDGVSTLDVRQENNKTPEAAEKSTTNWQSILSTMKTMLETPGAK